MELPTLFDAVLHLDTVLQDVIAQYGTWTYALLTLIIFCETGLVVTPFLPGDSLLFATGTFASIGSLNVWLLAFLLSAAAIIGDSVNYACGRHAGQRVFRSDTHMLLKREHLERTRAFFHVYGAKTIVLARFVPIVRTFAPFVAGIGHMHYPRFLAYNILGGVLWVFLFLFGGYLFGNIPIVRENFTLVILGIIGVSLMPGVVGWMKRKP